jgi:glycosyltransferase involved in cell wall biosynthesis
MSVFLVVPCFNEADRWSADYWANMVEQTNARYVFVDDGSSDETGTLLAEFANRHNVTFVRLATNGGKAEAVRQGWLEILKTIQINEVTALGFLDADGAFSAEDVSALIDLTNASKESHSPDAWWSSRVALAGRNIQRNLWRHYLGRVVTLDPAISTHEFNGISQTLIGRPATSRKRARISTSNNQRVAKGS